MSRQEIMDRLEKVEDAIWWLNMADRFTPYERARWEELHTERGKLKKMLEEVQ